MSCREYRDIANDLSLCRQASNGVFIWLANAVSKSLHATQIISLEGDYRIQSTVRLVRILYRFQTGFSLKPNCIRYE